MLSLFRKPKPVAKNLPGFIAEMQKFQDDYFVLEMALSNQARFEQHFQELIEKGRQIVFDPDWEDTAGSFLNAVTTKMPVGYYAACRESDNSRLLLHSGKMGVTVIFEKGGELVYACRRKAKNGETSSGRLTTTAAMDAFFAGEFLAWNLHH